MTIRISGSRRIFSWLRLGASIDNNGRVRVRASERIAPGVWLTEAKTFGAKKGRRR